MDLIEVAEIGMLLLGIYYGYTIFNGYTMIKSSQELFNRNRILLLLALTGVILFGLSFQVYWFTTFYERHKILDIFIKIILGIFSIINQMFVYEMEEEEYNLRKRKGEDLPPYMNDGKLGFKVVNRLLLLYIVYKFFNRNE